MSTHTTPGGSDFVGVRALIVGLAREGTALARFLAEKGAVVTLTDARSAELLAGPLAALADLPFVLALGGHPLALLDQADILFVSPGVPLGIPFLVEARRRGLPLSSETRLFTRLSPAPIVGITGSSGKTTTTALVGRMLAESGRPGQTWVGGNIGRPLISSLTGTPRIETGDTVVMELSSFQLEFFAPWPSPVTPGGFQGGARVLFDPAGWSPPLAAVLNVTPNHLDRHGTMEAYTAAKRNMISHQPPEATAILNLDNPATRLMGQQAGQRVLWFSLEEPVAQGAWLRGPDLILRLAGSGEQVICRTDELQMRGRHNVANVLAASLLAAAAGAPLDALRRAATTFAGVEHRLELVRERAGVRWYNDSIATSPERTVAALRSFGEPIILLAGGRDKHLPWQEMVSLTWDRVRHLVLFGEAAGLVQAAMQQTRPPAPVTQIHDARDLEGAVATAARLAQPGDVVLLSPGGTSFDAYPDFVARGEHFRQLVGALE